MVQAGGGTVGVETLGAVVPRYRFSWDNVPITIRQEIAAAAAIEPTANALRARFGARPNERFVQELWPTLRDGWLAKDDAARSRVVETVLDAGLGVAPKRRSRSADVEYLRSLRNSKTMRSTVLSEFHLLGEPPAEAESATASASEEPAAEDRSAIGRPTRKYVGFNTAADSPEGQEFIDRLLAAVGEPEVVPLGKVGNAHLFVAAGPDGRALVLETQGEKVDHSWRSLLAFRTDAQNAEEATLTMVRWDPWLAFEHEKVRDAPRAQRTAWHEERVKRAAGSDSLTFMELTGTPGLFVVLSDAETRTAWKMADEIVPRNRPATETNRQHEFPGEDSDGVANSVLGFLRTATGDVDLGPDSDGDIPVRFGTAMVFVRVFGDPPVVRVYSPVLGKVSSRESATRAVSELNLGGAFVKWMLSDDTVVAAIDLFGKPLIEDHVLAACHLVGSSADELDDRLQQTFGGKTFFGEHIEPEDVYKPPGYL